MKMTPERWQQVKAIFADAHARPTAERASFVREACAGDDELREEVDSLLSVDDGDDSLPGARRAIASAARSSALGATPDATDAEREASLRTMLEAAVGHQYEIVRPLGEGGMGTVYLACERSLDRYVAIKVLRPELAQVRAGRERFRREARVAAQLSHPGILPLHTFGEIGGLWYFVMGYVRGVTLAERLRIEGRIPPHEAQRILGELADALDCAHRGGVVHRDIKPANILLDADSGRAVLADFGIAKARDSGDSLTAPGMIIGTPSFMSPEQAVCGEADERSDIWSLGAVGWAMLAGRDPGGAVTAALRHDSAARQDLRTIAPDVPADLAGVITRCLQPDPAQRWPTARALCEALSIVDGDNPTSLPAAARELPAFGPYALLWAALWLALAASPFRSAGDRALLALVGLLVPAGLVLHVWNVSGGGLPASQLARVAFWPPDWWGMWWPRALRRPSDLWRRLPRRARLVRGAVSAFLVALPALILTREWTEAITGAGVGWLGAVEAAMVVLLTGVVGEAALWARARGLDWPDTARLLFGATNASASWRAKPLDRLLAPAHGAVRPPERGEPGDYARAIDDLFARLDPVRRERAAKAVRSGHALLALLARCDEELRTVGDMAAGDAHRIGEQLAALERGGHQDAETRELATLLRAQLGVLHRMRLRCELLSARKTRLLQLLHGLWSQLLAMQGASASSAITAETAQRHLETLAREIEAELDGSV